MVCILNSCGTLISRMCFTMDTSSKKSQVVITYWKNDECEEGDNVTLALYGLLADYMMGDLNLDVMLT